MSKHTPTPWRVVDEHPQHANYEIMGGDQRYPLGLAQICRYSEDELGEEHAANAAHIVHCVNTYPELVKALEKAVDEYGKPGGPWNVPNEPGTWIEIARAALAKAKVK
jgi:hypothetical protein